MPDTGGFSTGRASSIGRAFATRLAQDGAGTAVADLSADARAAVALDMRAGVDRIVAAGLLFAPPAA
jgi:NAD(P)-dependent dehydrogenase (short-subunit alcohol dehydrogenase family)